MFCTRCGFELRDADRYCSRCGSRIAGSLPVRTYQPLRLDKRNGKIAGVCAGLARCFEVDVVLVRVLTLVLALCTGVGFLAYIAAWIVIPSDHGFVPERIPPSADSSGLSFYNS